MLRLWSAFCRLRTATTVPPARRNSYALTEAERNASELTRWAAENARVVGSWGWRIKAG